MATRARAKGRANRRERRVDGLAFLMLEEATRVATRANRNRRTRKETRAKAREHTRKAKDTAVETTTPAGSAVSMATGEMNAPLKSRVNQVAGAGAVSSEPQGQGVPTDATSTTGSVSTRRTSASSATSSALSSASKSVRLVKMYNVATPPAEQPELYEMRSDLEDDCND